MKEEYTDKYLRGELNENLIKELQKSGESLSDLDGLKEGIRLSHLSSKLDMLKDFEADLSAKKTTKVVSMKKNNLMRYSIAASLAVLLGVGLWMFQTNITNTDQLYTDYYASIPAIDSGLRNEGKNENDLKAAYDLYNSQDYVNAEKSLADLSDYPRANFYRGISLMELQNYEEAILAFEKYNELNDDPTMPSYYYLALCHLKLGDLELSKANLKQVNSENEEYYQKAQNLLDEL